MNLLSVFLDFVQDFILVFLGSDFFYCLAMLTALAVAIVLPLSFCGLGAKK